MIELRGNTYPIRQQLKALGCRWDKERRIWLAPPEAAKQAQDLVDTQPAPERLQGGRAVPQRRCWECGCLFTYEECRRNHGDWNDSYCGC